MREYSVCVILVNYNSLDDTIECLKSLSQSKESLPFVVVVDNASHNQYLIEKELAFYSHLKVILSSQNVGFGRANNIGINWVFSNIQCDYVFLLNNDTTIENNTIELMSCFLSSQDENVGMIAPKILIYSNPKEIWYEGADIEFKKVTPTIRSNSISQYTMFASGCAMFFRYDTLKKIEGFDPYFFMYDEDVELCLRMKNKGIQIAYLPEAIVYHKCQGSQTKEKDIPSNQLHPFHPSLLFYLNNTIRNRKYIINKHLHGFESIKSTFFHSLYWIMKSFQYLLYGKFNATLCVLKHLISSPSKN